MWNIYSIDWNIVRFTVRLENVAEWLRHWTRDLGVWDSILQCWSCVKRLGKAFNPHCLLQPSSNGHQVEQKLVLCEWLQQRKGDETERVSLNILEELM